MYSTITPDVAPVTHFLNPQELDHTPWELAAYHFLKYAFSPSPTSILTHTVPGDITVDWLLSLFKRSIYGEPG